MMLRALGRLIGEVALWTGLVAIVAAAVAYGVAKTIGHGDRSAWRGTGAAVLGSLVFAGLTDRLGLPQTVVIDIGRRPLSLVWVVAGALTGAVLFWIGERRRRARAPSR